MKSEHWRPLVASIVVVLLCGAMMVHAIRTDAVGGLIGSSPMRVLAGELIQPRPVQAPPAPAPIRLDHRQSAPAPAPVEAPAPATVNSSEEPPAEQPVRKSPQISIHQAATPSQHGAIAASAVNQPTAEPVPQPGHQPSHPVSSESRPPVGSHLSAWEHAAQQWADAWSHTSGQLQGVDHDQDWQDHDQDWQDHDQDWQDRDQDWQDQDHWQDHPHWSGHAGPRGEGHRGSGWTGRGRD